MDFYRQSAYTYLTDDDVNIFRNHLSEFGFVNLDGTDLSTVSTNDKFRWRYDTSGETFFQDRLITAYNRNATITFYQIEAYYDMIGGNVDNSIFPYRSFIFIPLKNHNFILQLYLTSNLIITPPFLTCKSSQSILPYDTFRNTTKGSSITSFYVPNYNNFGYIRNIFMRSDSNITLPDISWFGCHIGAKYFSNSYNPTSPATTGIFNYVNLINHYPQQHPIQNERIYNNVNQGVCTLARVPYENTFLDGLYLCTTYPEDEIEGKFFSFNGRNFLGIYENLVVELPEN